MAAAAFVVTAALFWWFTPKSEPPAHRTPSPLPVAAPKPKPPPAPRIDKSEQAQKKRADLIRRLTGERVFLKIEMPGNLPRLWVGPVFHTLDFDTKSSFVSVVYAYHFDGNDFSDAVRIFDGRTGKEIGTFAATAGLRMF
jgi:hypothetical protein